MPYYFECDVCNYREEIFDADLSLFGTFEEECEDCGQLGCADCIQVGVCDDCRHRRLAEEDDEEEG